MPVLVLLALLFGATVGAVLGLLGGGGSVLAVPLLTYGLGVEPRAAVATSLVVVGVAALSGVAVHAHAGTVRLRVALWFGAAGALGSLAGSQLARLLRPEVQLLLFAATMLAAATFMLRRRAPAGGEGDHEADAAPAPARGGLAALVAGLGAGVLTGVVGVGGGFVVVPALALLVGLPMHSAVGTSLLVIALNSAGGFAGYASYVALDARVVVPFAVTASAAAVGGGLLARRLPAAGLRRAFAWGLVVVAIAMLSREGLRLVGG